MGIWMWINNTINTHTHTQHNTFNRTLQPGLMCYPRTRDTNMHFCLKSASGHRANQSILTYWNMLGSLNSQHINSLEWLICGVKTQVSLCNQEIHIIRQKATNPFLYDKNNGIPIYFKTMNLPPTSSPPSTLHPLYDHHLTSGHRWEISFHNSLMDFSD